MCDSPDSLSPRDRLARKIRARTNEGDDVLDYVCDVFYDREPGVLHGHRLQAGRLLVIYGQLGTDALQRLKEMSHGSDRKSRQAGERSEARLARTIRNMTDDGEEVVAYLLNTMNGIDSTGKKRVPHNARLACARELLKKGFPCECAGDAPASGNTRASAESAVIRSNSGSRNSASRNHSQAEQPSGYSTVYEEEQESIREVLEIIERAIDETDPSEYEEEESSDHKPDYTMWEMIRKQPRPVISEEHARIGAALFHEAVEKQRLWEESDVRIPTQKDHANYDDG